VRKFVIVGIAAGGNRTAALARGGNLYIWGGLLSAIENPELFREAAHRFGTVEVPEEGGVRDAETPVGFLERTAANFPGKPPALFAGSGPWREDPVQILKSRVAIPRQGCHRSPGSLPHSSQVFFFITLKPTVE